MTTESGETFSDAWESIQGTTENENEPSEKIPSS
jgi:hypothetical protein